MTWTEESWKLFAACKGKRELFFAFKRDKEAQAQARAICASCPVFKACDRQAKPNDDGIWAGKTKSQRKYRQSKANGYKRPRHYVADRRSENTEPVRIIPKHAPPEDSGKG